MFIFINCVIFLVTSILTSFSIKPETLLCVKPTDCLVEVRATKEYEEASTSNGNFANA